VDVSCAASGFCVAAGYYVPTRAGSIPILETLAAGTWSASTAPTAADGIPGSAHLNALSCPTLGSCVAVGSYTNSNFQSQGMIETLTNSTWTAIAAPTAPDDTPIPGLQAVSCSASTSCAALSLRVPTGTDIVTLSGHTWNTVHAPTPNHNDTDLVAVSCAAPGSCVAIGDGDVNDPAFTFRTTVIDTLADDTWTTQHGPAPKNTSNWLGIEAITSTPAGGDVAVGFYNTFAGNERPLVDSRE
jgi:hypothetical protein